MTTVDRQLVRRIFSEALELPPADRVDFINTAAAGDEPVRARVFSLLSALKDAGDFLGSPTEAIGASSAVDPKADTIIKAAFEGPGTRIGNYKLLQQIGEGGFGSVFMAEQQQPVVRRVALKIIKLGMDTRQVIARFEAERQALAMMDHPNIARVLDAGATETGRPYFVMELVRGDPITEYCDSHNLTTNERLELFMSVCQAVQHAHHKGIIHRDLKPSNVLIALHDGVPVPKVIDFGIAKATSARLTEKTLFTEFRQFIGTPEYMSPEQAGGSSIDVDTRSDVYSLGVLLYELLTGTTPFDSKQLRSAAFDEIKRIIREVDPPRPSTRVSTLGETANTIAARRHTEPRKLSQAIRGDLDWIVMRCLEKDRTRRYESANDLSRDIQRYMADQPVDATPPGMAYRTRKFLRRHRTPVIVAGTIAAALILGLVTTTIGLVMAQRERDVARQARQDEEAARITADEQRKRADDKAEQLRQELYVSQISRAQHLIETGGSEPVKPILAACDPQLRHWEWERLNWLADRSERTFQAHSAIHIESHSTIAYSPDGRRFLTYGDGGLVRIWDSETLRTVLEISGADRPIVTYATFSPDGTRIVVAVNNYKVHIHDSTSGQLIRSFTTTDPYIRCAAISPDNKYLVAGTWFSATMLWDVNTGDLLYSFDHNLARGESLQFSKDGSRLMIGSLGNDIAMIDMATGKPVWTERGAGFVVVDAAISPDGTKVASIGQDSRLWVRDARSGRLIYSIATGKGAIDALAFHPDDDFLAVVGSDGLITFFDSTNGENLGSLGGHEAWICGVVFHPNGRWMLSMDRRGVAKRWHLGSRQALSVLRAFKTINCTAFSRDNSLIYFGPTEIGLQVVDARTLEELRLSLEPIDVVSDLKVSPDGSTIAVAGAATDRSRGHIAALYNREGEPLTSWTDSTELLGFSSDSTLLVTADTQGVVSFRNVKTFEVVRTVTVPPNSRGRGALVDDKLIAFGCPDGHMRLVNSESGQRVRELKVHESAVTLFYVFPQQGLMVTSTGNDSLSLWNWPSGELRHQITETGNATSVALSPDGRRLIAGGHGMTVLMWDVQTGRRIMTVGKTTGGVGTVAFSPDGNTIITSAGDHAVRIWETQMPAVANLDKRYEVDVERRKVRRELLEYGRDAQQ